MKPPPDNILLRRTDDPEVRRDYVDVVASGWGMEGIATEAAAEIFFHPDSMGDPNVIAFVAYVDGKPASGCMALLSHGIAVGGNGATVSWARRRGLAEMCYAASLQVAYEDYGIRGSVCQSSPSGAGVWANPQRSDAAMRSVRRSMSFLLSVIAADNGPMLAVLNAGLPT